MLLGVVAFGGGGGGGGGRCLDAGGGVVGWACRKASNPLSIAFRYAKFDAWPFMAWLAGV